jgi:hypothetical protein
VPEYRRMHTVPQGYLSAFSDRSGGTKKPHTWRFERGGSADPKLLGVRDLCFVDDIYAIRNAAGSRDPVIERDLLALIDSEFCAAREKIVEAAHTGIELEDTRAWKALSIFVGFQLTRTPRSFQILRDEMSYRGVDFANDDLPKLMVYSGEFLDHWLWLMQWALWRVADDELMVTADNPAVNWIDLGHGARLGGGFADPRLIVSLPITPKVCFVATQTPASVDHIRTSTKDKSRATEQVPIPPVLLFEIQPNVVRKLNKVVVANAERYTFSSYIDKSLSRFMSGALSGAALVRLRDRFESR